MSSSESSNNNTINRPTTLPQRQVTIIITNNMEILRQTRQMHRQSHQQLPTVAVGNVTSANNHPPPNPDIQFEEYLESILDLELRQAARNYVSRTRRPNPIHYVVRLRDLDLGLN